MSTITDSRNDMTKLKNIHPGEILLEEFLAPMEISQNALARGIAVPPRRINEIVLSKRAVTADSQGITQGVQAKGVLLASHGYSP